MIKENHSIEYIANIKTSLSMGYPITDKELEDFLEEIQPIYRLLNRFGSEYSLVTKELNWFINKAADYLFARKNL